MFKTVWLQCKDMYFQTPLLNLESNPCFGIYYDSPNEVPAEELRSVIGFVLPEGKMIELKEEENIFIGKIDAIENGISFDTVMRSYAGMMLQFLKCIDGISKEAQCKTPQLQLCAYDSPEKFSVIIGTEEASEGLLAKYPE